MKKELYIYSLASETELPELKDIGKEWKDVSIISLHLTNMNEMKEDELIELGEKIIKGLVKDLIK